MTQSNVNKWRGATPPSGMVLFSLNQHLKTNHRLLREGYVSTTRDIVTTTRRIAEAIRATPGVTIVGQQYVALLCLSRHRVAIQGCQCFVIGSCRL